MATSRKRSSGAARRRTSTEQDEVSRYSRNAESYYGSSSPSGSDDAAERYSRHATGVNYARSMQKKRRRGKVAKRIILSIVIIAVVGVGAAWGYTAFINGNLGAGLGNARQALVKTNLTKEPFYMLLLGTDESAERDATGDFGGAYRSDTMILARIDPVKDTVSLISIPRDTQVTLPGYGTQKINAASALGGSAMAITTVSELSGVGISHFAMVDFDGFAAVVDSLGGISVDVPMTIDDDDAGGHLDAGLQTLNGEQALILCRARHAYDEYGDGDSYRSANQRLVLSAIADKLLSSDIGTIAASVTALSNCVTTDLQVNDIIGLAQAFQGFDSTNSMYTASVPTTSVYEDELWYEKVNTTAWDAMMQRTKQGLPPSEEDIVDETGTILATTGSGVAQSATAGNDNGANSVSATHTGVVVVRNGSGIAGEAQDAASKLTSIGYTVADVGNAEGFDYSQTIVVYADAARANEAKEIANTIGIGQVQMNDYTYKMTGDFLVVIGADYSA